MIADELKPKQRLIMKARATVPTNAALGSTIENCVELNGPGVPDSTRSCATTTIREPYSEVTVYKNSVFAEGSQQSQRPGDVFWYTLAVKKVAGADMPKVNLIDQLPAAFEYIPGTACANGEVPASKGPETTVTVLPSWGQYNGCNLPVADPEIVAGSPTAATNLLRWLSQPVPNDVSIGNSYYTVAFQVRVKPGTAISNYANVVMLDLPANSPNKVLKASRSSAPVVRASVRMVRTSTGTALRTTRYAAPLPMFRSAKRR